jgi:hypothetical protein
MRRRLLVAAAILAVAWTAAGAQDKPAPAAPAAQAQGGFTGPRIPLKVQFVLSRYQGEKRISSLPYVLGVLSNSQKTSLRMGVQIPIATGPKVADSMPSYQYRDFGTNIDCQAQDAGNGQFNLTITVSDSSIHVDSSPGAPDKQQQIVRDIPAFRAFSASFSMLLRDGQTMQYASATDPISGEVMRIDVSLTLAK